MVPGAFGEMLYVNCNYIKSIVQTKKEAILEYFSKMDIDMLELILDDSRTYQDATKETFLIKLNEVFIKFKSANDDSLDMYSGKCPEETCNKGCRGYSFVGNNSKKHVDFIFEETETDFKDVYHCCSFAPDEPDIDLCEEIPLCINIDEKANFKPSIEYLIKVQQYEKAYDDFVNNENPFITQEFYLYWLAKYFKMYKSLKSSALFNSKLSKFYWLYYQLNKIAEYLKFENEATKAVNAFHSFNVENEELLLKWLVEYEQVGDELRLLLVLYFGNEEEINTGYIKLSDDYNFRISVSDFEGLIRFQNLFDEHYWKMLDKYTTIKEADWGKLVQGTEESEKRCSLTYHLKKRINPFTS